MEKVFYLHLLVVALTIVTTLRPISTASPPLSDPPTTKIPPPTFSPIPTNNLPPRLPSSRPATPSPPPPRPPSPPTTAASPPPLPPEWAEIQDQLLKNIIDALISAGPKSFRRWAKLLSAADPSTVLPLTATLFVPSDDALSHFPTTSNSPSFPIGDLADPFLIPYHIIPQRLRFSDLQLFHAHTRLPTLLPSNSILITNDSCSNFTVDGSLITHPDLYVNPSFSVHGISNILDYSTYGGGLIPPPAAPAVITRTPTETAYFPDGVCGGGGRSAAGFPIVFWVVCAAFAFKIHR